MNHLDPVMIESIATKELNESETMPIAVIEQPVEVIEERVVEVEEPSLEPTVYFDDWGLLEQMRNSSVINNHYLLEQLLYKYGFIEETFGGSEVYGDLHLYSFTADGQKIVIAERINNNTSEWGLNYGVYGKNDFFDKGLMHSMLGIPYF